jgi:hypothetical protein
MVCCRGEGKRSRLCALAEVGRCDRLTSETECAVGFGRWVMCGSGERQKHCCATLVLKRRVNVACRRIESREMRTATGLTVRKARAATGRSRMELWAQSTLAFCHPCTTDWSGPPPFLLLS